MDGSDHGQGGQLTPKLGRVDSAEGAPELGCPESTQRLPRRRFRESDALLSRAQSQIALLRRLHPLNVAAISSRFIQAFRRGEAASMPFRYAPAPDLSALRAELDVAARELALGDAWCVLYAARALELGGHAALVEAAGTPSFVRLAPRHFSAGDAGEAECAHARAEEWARAGPGPPGEATVRSCDRSHPDSLVNRLGQHIGRLRLPVGIRVVEELASKAAVGDGVILVRAGVALSPSDAKRIALHELLGHMLPRLAARSQPLGLFRVGSAGSGADEEGRALLIEERAGLMHQPRRFELGLRHLAALAVRAGAEPVDVVRELCSFGCQLADAVAIYARVARGGGLCRELTYLPGWLRARRAFSDEPELERWLAHGRISIAAARRLRALGDAPIAGPFGAE